VRKTLQLLGGLISLAAGVGFAFFLIQYFLDGAGLQYFGPAVSSGSILLGLVHVVGLFLASVLCFVLGIGLCADGLVPYPKDLVQR
jgi:hypothetical protein